MDKELLEKESWQYDSGTEMVTSLCDVATGQLDMPIADVYGGKDKKARDRIGLRIATAPRMYRVLAKLVKWQRNASDIEKLAWIIQEAEAVMRIYCGEIGG